MRSSKKKKFMIQNHRLVMKKLKVRGGVDDVVCPKIDTKI